MPDTEEVRVRQEERDRHARSFGAVAGAYDRARPPYPPEAVDWLLGALPPAAPAAPGARRRVLDLAAGTGKLTRELVTRADLDVIAVEPLDAMRAHLTDAMPGVRALPGTAEDIPLPDDHLDAVLVAQAWHWFDHDRALDEIARVLRPGGTLGLLWNSRDLREPWVRELSALMHGADPGRPDPDADREERAFHAGRGGRHETAVEVREFTHAQEYDLGSLLDLTRSRSYVAVLPGERRDALLDAVTELTRTHPALAGRRTFRMPYLTRCFRVVVTS